MASQEQKAAEGSCSADKQAQEGGEAQRSFMDTIKQEAKHAGEIIQEGLETAITKINETVDKNYVSEILERFKTGNVIQLVNRLTGKTVQIVTGGDGKLILDANGPLDGNADNTLWKVTNEGSNQVRLQNNDNYIAFEDEKVVVKNYPAGTTLDLDTKFQLSQMHHIYVTLESLKYKSLHIAFLPTGDLVSFPPRGKESEAQFGVKVVTPVQAPA